jgi:hypothetical protein
MPWLSRCIESVAHWCRGCGYDYRWLGDEFFDRVDADLLARTRTQTVIATDLARLEWIKAGLADGYDCVVWCDADFLIFDAPAFTLPDTPYAIGREIWVQRDESRWRVYNKVHNAFLMFRRGNVFLEFYADAAARLLRLNSGAKPPQFIGPKLLSALHNIVQCPVMEKAGTLSPEVIDALVAGGGAALDIFRSESPMPLAGANLCASLATNDRDASLSRGIDLLLTGKL